MPKSNVSVGWGARVESVDESASRVTRLMSALFAIDPALSAWRNWASTQTVVTTDHTDLVQRLLDGRHRGDFGKQVIESLGYSLYWWNGADDNQAAARLQVHIGASSTAVGNSVVLELPEPDAVPSLYNHDTAHKLLRTLVQVFDPDSVIWFHHGLYDRQKEPDRPTEDGRGMISGQVVGQPAGWANYLVDSDPVKFDVGLLPANATVEHLGGGTLVMVGQDPADPPLDDVLQVRRAMGYAVPAQAPPS